MTLHSAANTADARDLLASFQRRLQQSIFRISEKVPPADRARLDAYIRHVSPTLRSNGESQLPASLRRMKYNADRTSTLIYPGIMYFHIGNAIVTFYDLCNQAMKPVPFGPQPPISATATAEGVATLTCLERRVKLVEQIAQCGPKAFVVIGTDRNGFTMRHKDEKDVPFLTPEEGENQPDPDAD